MVAFGGVVRVLEVLVGVLGSGGVGGGDPCNGGVILSAPAAEVSFMPDGNYGDDSDDGDDSGDRDNRDDDQMAMMAISGRFSSLSERLILTSST